MMPKKLRLGRRAPRPDWTHNTALIERVVDSFVQRRESRGHKQRLLDQPYLHTIVVKYYREGRPLSYIARTVRLNRGTVKQTLQRLNRAATLLGLK